MSLINQLNKDIATLEKSMADEIKKEADKNKRINDIKRSINKNTSPATLQSKSRQVDMYINDLAKIAANRAEISKKLVDKRGKLNTQILKLQKEQADEDKKRAKQQEQAFKQYQTQVNNLTYQAQNISQHISTMPTIRESSNDVKTYDVFISHASEDKDTFVRKLATTLRDDYDVEVWYDEFSINWGDSLRTAIDKGLKSSIFGIVVISRDFIKKDWTNRELDGLFQIETLDKKVILPIWHDITKNEVQEFSPILAGKKALSTAIMTVDEIAQELTKLLANFKKSEED
jgi:hypothetical protein